MSVPGWPTWRSLLRPAHTVHRGWSSGSVLRRRTRWSQRPRTRWARHYWSSTRPPNASRRRTRGGGGWSGVSASTPAMTVALSTLWPVHRDWSLSPSVQPPPGWEPPWTLSLTVGLPTYVEAAQVLPPSAYKVHSKAPSRNAAGGTRDSPEVPGHPHFLGALQVGAIFAAAAAAVGTALGSEERLAQPLPALPVQQACERLSASRGFRPQHHQGHRQRGALPGGVKWRPTSAAADLARKRTWQERARHCRRRHGSRAS